MHSRWPRLDGLAYGGEYYPEQWRRRCGAGAWRSCASRRHAGLPVRDLLHQGMVEPRPWRVRLRLAGPGARPAARRGDRRRPGHADGRAAALVPAPAPAGAPGKRPATGCSLGGGSRQAYCSVKPLRPRRRGGQDHRLARPALRRAPGGRAVWHVNNEVRRAPGECYCETSAAAFRAWLLRERYGDVATLNNRWGTAFWSQNYGDWDEIDVLPAPPPPWWTRRSGSTARPLQLRRPARAASRRERDILHELSPGIPGHHQLHGHQLARASTTGAGRRRWTSSPTTTT